MLPTMKLGGFVDWTGTQMKLRPEMIFFALLDVFLYSVRTASTFTSSMICCGGCVLLLRDGQYHPVQLNKHQDWWKNLIDLFFFLSPPPFFFINNPTMGGGGGLKGACLWLKWTSPWAPTVSWRWQRSKCSAADEGEPQRKHAPAPSLCWRRCSSRCVNTPLLQCRPWTQPAAQTALHKTPLTNKKVINCSEQDDGTGDEKSCLL